MGNVFTETFPGTDGTFLDTLSGWSVDSGESANSLAVDGSGGAYPIAAAGANYLNSNTSGLTEMYFSFKFVYKSIKNSSVRGLRLRYRNTSTSAQLSWNEVRLSIDSSGNSSFNLIKRVAGGSTVTTQTQTFTPYNGTSSVYNVTGYISGTVVTATFEAADGSQKWTLTGATDGVDASGYTPFSGIGMYEVTASSATTGIHISNLAIDVPNSGSTLAVSDSTLVAGLGPGEMWDTSQSGYIRTCSTHAQIDLTYTLPTGGGHIIVNCDSSLPGGAGSVFVMPIIDGVDSNTITSIGAGSTVDSGYLPAGAHRIRFYVMGATINATSRWDFSGAIMGIKVTSLTIPTGTTIASEGPTDYGLWIGDSIPEGNSAGLPGVTTVSGAWSAVRYISEQMGMAVSASCWGGGGFTHAGSGMPYGALNPSGSGTDDTWDHVHKTLARTFTTKPKFVVVQLGTNDWFNDPNTTGHTSSDTNCTDTAVTGWVTTIITRARAKIGGTAPIFFAIPYGGYKRTAIQAGITASGDARSYLIDLGFGSSGLSADKTAFFAQTYRVLPAGITRLTTWSPDGAHLYKAAHLQLTPWFVDILTHRLQALNIGYRRNSTNSLSGGI